MQHVLRKTLPELLADAVHIPDWARHRARKAAAKLHMNYMLGNLLPSFAIVEDAGHHDSTRAEVATANLGDGDILVADRAYTDFGFLNALALRLVSLVVREKTNPVMEVVTVLQASAEQDGKSKSTQILKDEIVRPSRKGTAAKYTADGGTLRRVTAVVEVRGQMRQMVFFTNNFARLHVRARPLGSSDYPLAALGPQKRECFFGGYAAGCWEVWRAETGGDFEALRPIRRLEPVAKSPFLRYDCACTEQSRKETDMGDVYAGKEKTRTVFKNIASFPGKVSTATQLKNEARWMVIVRYAFRKFQFVKHEFPPWIGDQYILNL